MVGRIRTGYRRAGDSDRWNLLDESRERALKVIRNQLVK
jgi:predicted nucleotidyltransferase